MAQLILKHLTKSFSEGSKALDDFNLIIKENEFLAVVGPSGCGKTTLLRLIAGLEEITSGDIILNGNSINDIPPQKRNMAVMFQNYVLFPHMTVYQNMAFGLKLRKVQKSEVESRVKKIANTLGISTLLSRYPKELSGGQRQRAALGRAVLRKPEVFLLDEPLSNLDAKMRTQMRVEIHQLQKKLQTTMIFVTHDQAEAMTMGDRIVVLKDGKIQQVSDPMTLYNFPANKFVAGFIGTPSMNFFQGSIAQNDTGLFFNHRAFKFSMPKSLHSSALSYLGKEVCLGIRPEHIHVETHLMHQPNEPHVSMKATVQMMEQMGSYTLLYGKIDNELFVIKIDSQQNFSTGMTLNVYLLLLKTHFFDNESKNTIFT